MIRPPPNFTLFPSPPFFRFIDRRFDERRADCFTLPVPFTVVGDGFLFVTNVGLELRHACRQFLRRCEVVPNQLEVYEQLSQPLDRKSTRLNSSHSQISYAVF